MDNVEKPKCNHVHKRCLVEWSVGRSVVLSRRKISSAVGSAQQKKSIVEKKETLRK